MFILCHLIVRNRQLERKTRYELSYHLKKVKRYIKDESKSDLDNIVRS